MPDIEQAELKKREFVTLRNLNTGEVVKVIFPNGLQVGVPGVDSFNKGIVLPNLSSAPANTANALYAVDGSIYFNGVLIGVAGGSNVTVKDEGSTLVTTLSSLNFVGAGVSATASGNDVTVTVTSVPGGSDTFVQFNDGGTTFGGDSGLTYNKTTDSLTVTGDVAVNGGDLTSTATTFNLLNSTVTTLNIGGAATVINAGAATAVATVGKSELGTFTDSSSAYFSHKDATVATGYALFQADPAGSKNTWVNAPTGGKVYISNNDNELAYFDDNEIVLTGKAGTAQTVTLGSTTGASTLTLQAGSGGITEIGNVTINGNLVVTGSMYSFSLDENLILASQVFG
jgi:hypothetical protein